MVEQLEKEATDIDIECQQIEKESKGLRDDMNIYPIAKVESLLLAKYNPKDLWAKHIMYDNKDNSESEDDLFDYFVPKAKPIKKNVNGGWPEINLRFEDA